MRTTITLEPDVAALVQRIMRERRLTFKQAVNETLRAALRPRSQQAPVRIPTFAMHAQAAVDLTKARQRADELDDDAFVNGMSEDR